MKKEQGFSDLARKRMAELREERLAVKAGDRLEIRRFGGLKVATSADTIYSSADEAQSAGMSALSELRTQ